MIWNPEVIARLKELHAENLSFSEIANGLSLAFETSVSRSACIGKAHRLGLVMRIPTPADHSNRAKKRATRHVPCIKPAGVGNAMRLVLAPKIDPLPLRLADVQPRHLTLIELEADDCRYPYGDSQFTFCGCTKAAGKPYCAPHNELCEGDKRIFERRSRSQRFRRAREGFAA